MDLADDARRRWSSIPPWRSTGSSRTRSVAATRACSTPCWTTPATSAARSARPTSASSTSTSNRSATSSSGSKGAGKRGELQGWRPTLDKPNIPRPPDGIPQNIADHMRLMCDILVLGFQTDTTRITTLKLNNDHSSLRFPNLGVDYMIHHLLSHSDTADWLKVNQFFVEQLAYIARKLDAIQEGERTALDNSMLMFCSSMMSGGHDATQLPVVMLGRGGGKIQTGRVLDYREEPNRQMCRLYLSMMDKMDVQPRPLRRRHRAAARSLDPTVGFPGLAEKEPFWGFLETV